MGAIFAKYFSSPMTVTAIQEPQDLQNMLPIIEAANCKLYDELQELYEKSARIYAAVNIVLFIRELLLVVCYME